MSMIYTDKDLNGNSLLQVGKLELTGDATGENDAVRKSQAEAISSAAVQGQIVNSLAHPSITTTLNTQQLKAQIGALQVIMAIDASSTGLLEIVDGHKIKVKALLDVTHEDLAFDSLNSMLAAATFNGDGTFTVSSKTIDKNTSIFLTDSVNQQDYQYVYKGTNNGNASDFISASLSLNQTTIRSMLAASGTGIHYDTNTGTTTLTLGTQADDLGAHTLPIDAAVMPAGTIADFSETQTAIKKLAQYAKDIDTSGANGLATIRSEILASVGITSGDKLPAMGGLIEANKSVSQALSILVSGVESATLDRAAIRSEFAAADTTLQTNIDAEASTRANADAVLTSNLNTEQTARIAADTVLTNDLNTEQLARVSADNELDNRLDIIEGSDVGSIVKAKADAISHADSIVATEQSRAEAAEASIVQRLDNELVGDTRDIGFIDASGQIQVPQALIDAGETRNGLMFKDVLQKHGNRFTVIADVVITFDDGSILDLETDNIVTAGQTVAAGSAKASDFYITASVSNIVKKSDFTDSTIELNGDVPRVKSDSIGRAQLDSAIESDIDDKVSLTADAQTITGKALLIEQSDPELGASYGLYVKKEQTGTGALTGTSRSLLVENHVNTSGSGNPAAPSYAHNTLATHYVGSCSDLSVAISGVYAEANAPTTAAINAVGAYAVSSDQQLGVNIGLFAAAENAAVSNISVLGYASTDGLGADRGVVGAVTSQSLALYQASRTADPFPYEDIAIVADAKYAPSDAKALYVYGDAVLEGGVVSVPSATTDGSAVNLGDLKAKQDTITFDLSSGSKVISTSLDLSKVPPIGDGDLEHGVSGVTVVASKDVANSQISFTATGTNVSDLTSVTVFLQEFLVSARSV